MAEAVGFAASIIAILELSSKAISYLRSVAGAHEDRRRLLNEVVNASSLLSLLHIRLQGAKGSSTEISLEAVKLLMVEDGPLSQFQSLLSDLLHKLHPKGVKGPREIKDLLWPFKQAEYKEIIDSLERYKTCLLLAIQNDHLELSKEIRENINGLHQELQSIHMSLVEMGDEMDGVFRGVTEFREKQDLRYQEQRNQEIIEWLSPLTFWVKQKDIYENRQEGTGIWVLESSKFKEWVCGESPTLYCRGLPGAGKTFLSSIIIDYLERNRGHNSPNVAVVYIYCSYNEQKKQTAINLIGSILRQLVSKLHSTSAKLPYEVITLYQFHARTFTRPSLNDYYNTIRKVACAFGRIFVVVDALDECAESDELCSRIQDLLSLGNFGFLATSRPLKSIDELFTGATNIEIYATETDVRRYLDSQIWSKPRLRAQIRRSPGLSDEIIDKITQKTQGMFLLAQLHFDAVATKHSVRKIRETLDTLPQGLDATYDHALERIASQAEDDRALAMRILTWITCSFTPMTPKILQHGVAMEPGLVELDEDDLPDIDLMVSVCAGLVIADQEGYMRLVHYTAQEYFVKNRENLFPKAHSEIAAACITYLSLKRFDEGPLIDREAVTRRLEVNPFLGHAAHEWGNHVREQSDPEIKQMTLAYLKQRAKLACTVELLFYRFRGRKYLSKEIEIQKVLKGAEAVLVAAYFGMEETFWHIVETEHPDLTMTNSMLETSLMMAAKKGRSGMVRLLLEHKEVTEQVDSRDVDGRAAFSWAAQFGNEIEMSLLLQHNADPDQRDRTGRSPLSWAASEGQSAVVKRLLGMSCVDPNSRDMGGWTPLLWAARLGKVAVVCIFLEQEGVNCDTPDEEGRTPLSWAAGSGEEAVVELLLTRKEVDPRLRDNKYGRTPLHRAAENGHHDIVKLLLDRQEVNASQVDFDGQTPLSVAARFGRDDVVRLLLSRADVDPNTRSKGRRTPLYWAARKGYGSVVRLLLEREDIDPTIRDEYSKTPLAWASINGHHGVVRLLEGR